MTRACRDYGSSGFVGNGAATSSICLGGPGRAATPDPSSPSTGKTVGVLDAGHARDRHRPGARGRHPPRAVLTAPDARALLGLVAEGQSELPMVEERQHEVGGGRTRAERDCAPQPALTP